MLRLTMLLDGFCAEIVTAPNVTFAAAFEDLEELVRTILVLFDTAEPFATFAVPAALLDVALGIVIQLTDIVSAEDEVPQVVLKCAGAI